MYQNRWSDCIGRVIFDSIDDIRQEIWRILCKCGQYQGDFLKALFKMLNSSVFATYLKDKMSKVGLRSKEKQKMMSDLHHRVQGKLNFHSVRVCDSFVFCLLYSPLKRFIHLVHLLVKCQLLELESVCQRSMWSEFVIEMIW
jgi:hypothetical protein